MKEYNYNTRHDIDLKITDDLQKRINSLFGKSKKLALEILSLNNYRTQETEILDSILSDFRNGKYNKPSDIFRGGILFNRGFSDVLDVFVPKKFKNFYLYIIDKLNKFQYSNSIYRRSMRTSSYIPYLKTVFRLLNEVKGLYLFEDYSISKLLNLEINNDELRDYFQSGSLSPKSSLLIASAIDLNDGNICETIENIIMSENNTMLISNEIIRGIIMSDNVHLHKVLGDFLLAARLQEGVRQAVCENMDCGTIEAFITLFDVIEKNDLIRYSSVKRAASTWIGIFDENNVDRINLKLLTLMSSCLKEKGFANDCIKSEDAIKINVGLWSIGFYNIQDAIDMMNLILKHGTRVQKIAMSYYNTSLELEEYKRVVAKDVFESYADDSEMLACYLPSYINNFGGLLHDAVRGYYMLGNNDEIKIKRIDIYDLFSSADEALRHFNILEKIYVSINKKQLLFSPCIFPWYAVSISKSEIIARMGVIAYALEDEEKINIISLRLTELEACQYKENLILLLLTNPNTEVKEKALVNLLSSRDAGSRKASYKISINTDFSQQRYIEIENMLKYKSSNLRENLIKLLMMQKETHLYESVKRLLLSQNEEMRTAGLDIIIQINNEDNNREFCNRIKELISLVENPTEKEQIIIDEIVDSKSIELINSEGYGVYKENVKVDLEEINIDKKLISDTIYLSEEEILDILNKLDSLIESNKSFEYKGYYGDELLLGNQLIKISYDESLAYIDRLPLANVWKSFYDEHIHNIDSIIQIQMYSQSFQPYGRKVLLKQNDRLFKIVFGRSHYDLRSCNLKYQYHICTIINAMHYDYAYNNKSLSRDKLFDFSISVLSSIIENINENEKYCKYDDSENDGIYYIADAKKPYIEHPYINLFTNRVKNYETDEEFMKSFPIMYRLSQLYRNDNNKDLYSLKLLDIIDFIKAYSMNLIKIDTVYDNAFKHLDIGETLRILALPLGKNINKHNARKYFRITGNMELNENNIDDFIKSNPSLQLCKKIYLDIIEVILSVELNRGDSSTAFTYCIKNISIIYGCDRLVQILKALGNEVLDRNNSFYTYYSYSYGSYRNISKRESLSHLLSICFPNKDDDENKLRELLNGTSITEKRIIETAMYSPQWIDIIERYLGWTGLKSGCYYFMAHMNEKFDDKKAAIIAKYTPLSKEELNNGAFDIDWFKESYEVLGEKRFNLLYNSAKYISDGSKHSRARKYADAVIGKYNIEDVKKDILEKRNKDLLMAYSLIPFSSDSKDKDMLERYEFLQKFLKDSKQYGAQRRASEALAVEIAMLNLSKNTGFTDVTRFTLKMEAMLVEGYKQYFVWNKVEDIEACIEIDDEGKSEIKYRKDTKIIKNLPKSLKNNEFIEKLKQINKSLKEQYSRTKKMLEVSMEDKTVIMANEINNMYNNPIVRPLVDKLLFTDETTIGFYNNDRLIDYLLNESVIEKDTELRIVHPFDLYKGRHWHDYQRVVFDRKIKQPFKQVFRELYVKTEEEFDKSNTLRYAGNQIQPKKTVACLKGRRWIADFEDGLQKVFYDENLIARIYAMADWFSPSDIEAPTLEWVEFSNRKTFEPVKIKDIPDIIFSEVMRDVDLAVSVAHAGGVDPMTSHSTVEMRKIIIEFNLQLFKLSNVRFEHTHAIIKGNIGEYSVHLGSGVVHQIGGHQINILPVHSQHRGKLFLPFIDEDPKTAEIMSKVVLLAEDNKIKDPYILNQIEL